MAAVSLHPLHCFKSPTVRTFKVVNQRKRTVVQTTTYQISHTTNTTHAKKTYYYR